MRPSHLMFTSGVGSIVDLPNFSVLVRGLDEWRHDNLGDATQIIAEPRLLAAVQAILGKTIGDLRPAPWLPGIDTNPNGDASRVGVPVLPFPSWMRCTTCNLLAPIDTQAFGFQNDKARKPHEAQFFHECGRGNRKRRVVGARFVLACAAGHLDDFPYLEFVHRGEECSKVAKPNLLMEDIRRQHRGQRADRLPALRRRPQHPRGHGTAWQGPTAALPGAPPPSRHVRRAGL
ncbi:hypothetical protein [Streptosporangium vulgare]|uniref:hypothetical protein n=1 Tax=Streptosporangium vulgare TaxID=46190 RepID=UPI0031D64E8C